MGAIQDDQAEDTRTQRVDARRAGGEDEMQVRKAGQSDTIPRGRATRRGLREDFRKRSNSRRLNARAVNASCERLVFPRR